MLEDQILNRSDVYFAIPFKRIRLIQANGMMIKVKTNLKAKQALGLGNAFACIKKSQKLKSVHLIKALLNEASKIKSNLSQNFHIIMALKSLIVELP